MTEYAFCDSPIGPIRLAANEGALSAINFPVNGAAVEPPADWRLDMAALAEPVRQLQAYFTGDRDRFELPLHLKGTPFQVKVWRALCEIPFGETASYGEIAARIGQPGASRAVGGANNKNPLPIIVPCHRVIGADKSLTGFGGGVDIKIFLLEHERRLAPVNNAQPELPL